jgi:hypothetical protein
VPRNPSQLSRLLAVALLPACGGGGDGSPTAPNAARIAVAVDPSPIVSRVCDCGPLVGELDFEAHLVITESAGVAARLAALPIALRADAGNRVVVGGELPTDQGEVDIPAGGTLRHRFLLHFPGANQAVPATLDLVAVVVDAAGNRSESPVSVRVLPPPS